MKSFNEKEWNNDKEIIACQVTPESFPGLLKKSLKVPRFTKAFIHLGKGRNKLYSEGTDITENKKAVLVKNSNFEIIFSKKGLTTKEKYLTSYIIHLTFMAGETDFATK